MKKIVLISISIFVLLTAFAQDNLITTSKKIDYSEPKEYEIGGVTISGVQYLDQNVLLYLTGLEIGKKIMIPGDEITKAINVLWEQGLFADVKITLVKVINDKAFIDIYLEERPRLSRFSFTGIKKSEADDIRDLIKLVKGTQVTENTLLFSEKSIKDYFVDKGFRNVSVDIKEDADSALANSVNLIFDVTKGERVKIDDIIFIGNDNLGVDKKFYEFYRADKDLADFKLHRAMKETKRKAWYNVFKPSKLLPEEYEVDKQNIIDKYNEKGYRDARIISDSIFNNPMVLLQL